MRPLLKATDKLLLAICLMALSASFVWLQQSTSYGEATQRRRLNLQLSQESSETSNNQKHTFKILQLADLHMGEASDTDWGPEQDENTFAVLESVIPAEKPDLIVLSGDQLTANNIDVNATAYLNKLCQHLKQYNIPWAMIFGNHDDAPLEKTDKDGNVIRTNQTKTSREDLYHVDHSFAPLSLTQLGPKNLFGTSNYMLDVYDAENNNQVALQLLMLDTGGGTLPKQLEANQVEWFQSQRHGSANQKIPVVAFQHIPTQEFTHNDDTCEGMQDDGVEPIDRDPCIVEALHQDGNVHFLTVGHMHGNDYCCSYGGSSGESSKMHVCFGRHSGYGGYGRWSRGARVYEMHFISSAVSGVGDADDEDDVLTAVRWKSWVRMEWGDVEDEYSPYGDMVEEEEEDEEDNE